MAEDRAVNPRELLLGSAGTDRPLLPLLALAPVEDHGRQEHALFTSPDQKAERCLVTKSRP